MSETESQSDPAQPAGSDASWALDPARAQKVERTVAEYVEAVASLDPGTQEFLRTVASIDRLGQREFSAAAAMSSRMLERRLDSARGLLAAKAPLAHQLAELRKIDRRARSRAAGGRPQAISRAVRARVAARRDGRAGRLLRALCPFSGTHRSDPADARRGTPRARAGRRGARPGAGLAGHGDGVAPRARLPGGPAGRGADGADRRRRRGRTPSGPTACAPTSCTRSGAAARRS